MDQNDGSGPWTKAKQRVQDFVASWAQEHDVSPTQLLFKWEIKPTTVLQEHQIELNQRSCVLTIYLGRRSQALIFSGPSFSRSNVNPELFLAEHKERIIKALRKLRPAGKGA